MAKQQSRGAVGLPPKPFLYTLEQIADLTSIPMNQLHKYVWYEGRDIGPRPVKRVIARDIAPAGEAPAWRVAENELLRWLRACGFRPHDRGFIVS